LESTEIRFRPDSDPPGPRWGSSRVSFKIAVLVFQCLTGQAPTYLADDCQLTSDVSTRRLRSTDTAMCRPVFCGCWTTPVKHNASPSTAVRQPRTV